MSTTPSFQLDFEEINHKVLNSLIKEADLVGHNDGPKRKWPLLRLCRRPCDGDKLLESVGLEKVPLAYKNRMLEEAIKGGSESTVKVVVVLHIHLL